MDKIKRPDLAPIKGIALVARARFRIRRALVERIASELGEGYLHLDKASDKRQRYTLAATSFVEVDEQHAMGEFIEIAHCERGFVHFRYEESNGPKRSEDGTALVPGYDDDVGRILDALSSLGPKSVEVTYSLRPAGAPPIPPTLELGLAPVSLAGMKVLVGDKRKPRDSVMLDWEDTEQVKVSIRATRTVQITPEWPVLLIKYSRDILGPLRKVVQGNAEHAKK